MNNTEIYKEIFLYAYRKEKVATLLNIPDYFTPPVRSLGTTIPVYGYH